MALVHFLRGHSNNNLKQVFLLSKCVAFTERNFHLNTSLANVFAFCELSSTLHRNLKNSFLKNKYKQTSGPYTKQHITDHHSVCRAVPGKASGSSYLE